MCFLLFKMSSTNENIVLDFDLDFLNPTGVDEPLDSDLQARADRLRKSILFLKPRVKTVDQYVSGFYSAHNTVQEKEVIETQLKDRCKQHHVELGNFIEKVTRLENELQSAEAREREKTEKISELENQIVALQKLQDQLKLLEIEKNKPEATPVKVEKKNGKAGVTKNAKKGLVEIETLRKENAKILILDKENEKLRKEIARIPSLEKEIESLRKNISKVSKSEKINENIEIARIQKLEKEIESLCKENARISKLEREIETLNKKNAELSKLEKEIENLQKENIKIPKLTKEIESLRKENAKITKLGNEDEKLFKQSVIISNLEKDIETLRIKNAKFEMENKALRKEIDKVKNKEEDIETRLPHLTPTTNDKGKLPHKLPRKHKSLPDRSGEWSDHSEDRNDVFEDPLLSPTSDDTVIARMSPIADKDVEVPRRDSDNDNCNEVASVDTGRGSSVANSDTDKSLHSPEYVLNNNPPNGKDIENQHAPVSKSSILFDEIETSPIIIIEHDKNQNDCEPTSESKRKSNSKLSGDPSQTIAAREITKSADTSDNFSAKKRTRGEQEKECLELNNSLRCNSRTDVELGHIFSTMKLNFRLVSPIPRTPVWLPEADSTFSPIELQKKRDLCNRLTKETGVFLMQLSLRLDADPNSVTMKDYDRLIACFDSILKLRQILTECSMSNTNSNIEISDCVLSHDDHNLVSISYPEPITTSSEKETELCQNKKGENRLSQDESRPLLQDKIQNRMLRDDNNLITNPSPIHMDSNVIKYKQVEKCLNKSMDESQILNNSVSEEVAMSNEISDVIECDVPITNSVVKKTKNKKITKLGRLKKKLKPKYKIRMEKTPPRNLRIESKQLSHDKKKVTVNDTSASLNQKEAYEKAVKVMAELNSQKGAKAKSSPIYTKVLRSPRRTASLETSIDNNCDNQAVQNDFIKTRSKRKFSELFDTCTVVLVKDPLLCSPVKANSTNHTAEEDNNSISHRAREIKNFKAQGAKKDDHVVIHKNKEDNDSTTHIGKEDNDSTTYQAKDTSSTTHRAKEDNNFTTHQAKDNSSTTQRAKEDDDSTTHQAKYTSATTHRAKEDNDSTTHQAKDTSATTHRAKEDNDSTTHQAKDTSSTTYRAKEDNSSMTHQAKDTSFTTHTAKEDNGSATHQAKDISSTTPKAKEDNNFTTHQAKEDNNFNTHQAKEDNNFTTHQAKDTSFLTHRAKEDNDSTTHQAKHTRSTTQRAKEDNSSMTLQAKEDNSSMTHQAEEGDSSKIIKEEQTEDTESCNGTPSRKRRSSNEPLIQFKRVLRSTTTNTRLSTEDNIELSKSKGASNRKSITGLITNDKDSQHKNKNDRQCLQIDQHNDCLVSYGDLDVFSEDVPLQKKTPAPVTEVNTEATTCHPKESILCYMLEKHGVETVRPLQKKIPDNTVKQICEKIEQGITSITEARDNKNAMNDFVDDLRKLNYKHFIAGLIKFLAKPERKDELFGKVYSHPAPPMTKAEQILLYAINQLETNWPSVDIVDAVLSSIEFTLFKLNRTPEFNVIETTSHFYAILCRYVKAKSRLRLFMLDAMYCIQFKSVPLIKQCLEVWMHIIPLSHMGLAKTPLVTCLVYLLHFYKCEDKFNRVNEIRKILRDKYYYQITDWNEAKILEMFKNSIKDLKEISIEKKMLRLALIILAKRQGPQWCQNNIIKNLLQPMIEKEKRNNVKEFCVSMIGPLMKPYPIDMKVHCEIAINQLVDILNNNPSPEMEEAAITSMMYINRHDQRSVNKTLLSRKMKPMSSALEKAICEYVKAKPLKIWMTNLTTIRR